MNTKKPATPFSIPAGADTVMSMLPQRRIKAVAIKRLRKGSTELRPSHILLLMFDDGMVATFDNTDGLITTTGGLNSNGWNDAMHYAQDIMRIVHYSRLENSDAPNAKVQVVAHTVESP